MIVESVIKAVSELIWLWVVIELNDKEILVVNRSKKRSMFFADRILSNIIDKYGSHSVSSDSDI